MKRRIGVALLAAVAVFPGTVRAGAPPEIKCAATKQKAASAKEKAKALCYAKAAGAKVPTPVDPACLAKAEAKFQTAFTKAVAKGPCADPGNGLPDPSKPIEDSVDACVSHITDQLPGTVATAKCTAAKIKAAGADAAGELACYAKAAGAKVPTPVDPACLAKVAAKLGPAFTKADSGKAGACPGDAATLQAEIDGSCVTTIANQLPPKPPGCGNRVIEPGLGETCDDGNTIEDDGCPSSCHVDTCTPMPGTTSASVTFTSGTPLGGLVVFIDYPEGKVASLTVKYPFGVTGSSNDLGYGVKTAVVKIGALPAKFATLTFANLCQGAAAPTAADFRCTVEDAADTAGNAVDPSTVTCSVSIP
jgi:cysteine-rich repeat protein